LFGRSRQSHECSPAMSLDEYFSTGPERERPVFDAVMAGLVERGITDIHVEPVSVGLFLKTPARFLQLRPMTRWVAVSFMLDREARHRTFTRQVKQYGDRWYHVANVTGPDDVDDALLDLLAEAHRLSID
jgi:hypothetical protein